jgi:tetrahydromethanopterin S-methyltransferase subunit F
VFGGLASPTVPEYLAPGVYVEEISYRAKAIAGVSTGTTGLGAIRDVASWVGLVLAGVLIGVAGSIAVEKVCRGCRRSPPHRSSRHATTAKSTN